MEPRGFADAVREVARGGSALDPEVVAQMLDGRRPGGPIDTLTDRERDVLAGWPRAARTARSPPTSGSRSTRSSAT